MPQAETTARRRPPYSPLQLSLALITLLRRRGVVVAALLLDVPSVSCEHVRALKLLFAEVGKCGSTDLATEV